MAVARQTPELVPRKALQTKSFELPDELRHTLHRASDLIRERRATLREEPLPTSLAGLDHLLDGGLPRGEMVELVGRGSCGRFAALLATLRAVTGAGEAAALVDQGAQLDPQAAAEIGVDLEHLLWLRPQNLGDSVAAAELLVHTGFPLVALDLGLPPVRGRAPLAAWLRLARNAANHQAVVLVGSPYRLSGCAAGVVVTACRGRGDWRRGGASRLLSGLRARLHLSKRIGHPNCDQVMNALTLPEAAFGEEPISDLGFRNSPTAAICGRSRGDRRHSASWAGEEGWEALRPLADGGESRRPKGVRNPECPPALPQDSAPSEDRRERREKHVSAL